MHSEENAKTIWCCTNVADKCVASKCMAWRWLSDERVMGYCGLAGLPHGTPLHVNADIRGDVNNHY